jgi:hypothetical protein
MKRKLIIVLGAVVLVGGIIFWRYAWGPTETIAELSQKDFESIRQATRQAMWRAAFPDFSARTIIAAPRSLYRLSTSRIAQIDILPGELGVRVQTGSDIYFYMVKKYQQKVGPEDWRIVRHGVGPGDGIVINLNGGPGFTEIRVDGGFGLVGGRLSTEPVPWEVPLPRPGTSRGRGDSASGSNHIRLTYETHPLDPDDVGPPTPWKQRSVFPETQFSTSLSNSVGLNLRP